MNSHQGLYKRETASILFHSQLSVIFYALQPTLILTDTVIKESGHELHKDINNQVNLLRHLSHIL